MQYLFKLDEKLESCFTCPISNDEDCSCELLFETAYINPAEQFKDCPLVPIEEEIPYICFSASEINSGEKLGATIRCRKCGLEHEIKEGMDTNTLNYTVCADGRVLMVGMHGRKVEFKDD